MAEYRTVQSKVWRDDWFSEQAPDAKLLFVYLFTNSAASVSGIYQLPLKFIAFDTGLTSKRVRELLSSFQKAGKIEWCEPIIWVRKMREYQATKSVKVQIRIERDLSEIPDCAIKRKYIIAYQTGNIPYPESEIPYPELESETETDTERETDTSVASAPEASADQPPAKNPNARQAAIGQLEESFAIIAHLAPPEAKTDNERKAAAKAWWKPLGEILDLAGGNVERAETLMQGAVQKLTEGNLTIAAPRSIVNTAIGINRTLSPPSPDDGIDWNKMAYSPSGKLVRVQ